MNIFAVGPDAAGNAVFVVPGGKSYPWAALSLPDEIVSQISAELGGSPGTVVFTPDLRVFFQAEGLEEGRTVRMRVWVDEESRFDVSRDPFINPMSFLFQYNGRLFGSDVNLL